MLTLILEVAIRGIAIITLYTMGICAIYWVWFKIIKKTGVFMQDTIDASHWLNQSFHKAYPDAMGRVSQHNGRYTVATQFAFDDLYSFPPNNPIFTASHLSAAEFITTLREVAFHRTGYGTLREMANRIGGDGQEYCAMTLYCSVMKKLTRPQASMVERICFQPLKTNDWGWITTCAKTVQGAFEELGKAIELSLDEYREKAENGVIKRGEVRPDFTPA